MALERFITKHLLLIHMMTLSLLLGDGTVQIQLYNGQEVQGEFIGTYMNHVHILTEEETYYYACDDILSVLSPRKGFDYDCSENTVTADILFPPELDPMTGEWVQRLPDVFNPDIAQPVVKKETDGIDTNPPTVDLSVVETQFDEQVSTFEKKDDTEEDFIMINGVKYVKAAPNRETNQDNLPRTTKKKKRKKRQEAQLSNREIQELASYDAKRNHDEFIWTSLSLGTSMFGWLVKGKGCDACRLWRGGPSEFNAVWGGLGLAGSYLVANNFDATYDLRKMTNVRLSYPNEIKTQNGKKLYKTTYVSKTRRLRKDSVMVGSIFGLGYLLLFSG